MEQEKISHFPGMPAPVAWLVEFDEPLGTADGVLPEEDMMQSKRHVVFEAPEGHYAHCATPLLAIQDVLDLGYAGWIPLPDELPKFMSGYIALLHPDQDEPTVSYVGVRPVDFREDGYTHFMPLARLPREHVLHRRKVKSQPQASKQA